MPDEQPAWTALSTHNLGTMAYETLRARIISGELRRGVTYSVPRLAAALGISPTPVREATLALVGEGLLTIQRNKGFRVVELEASDLDDILELRLRLELPATVSLAGRLDEAALDELDVLAERTLATADVDSLDVFLEADRRLHQRIMELAGNARATTIVMQLRTHARLYGLSALHRDELRASALEHQQIVAAIRSGDEDETARLMEGHLRQTRGAWSAP